MKEKQTFDSSSFAGVNRRKSEGIGKTDTIGFPRRKRNAYRLDFEPLLSEISFQLCQPFPVEADMSIDASLQKILDSLQIDRAALFQEQEEGSKRFILTNVKCRPGCSPTGNSILTKDSFPWMIEQYLSGRETRYSRIDDLPKEASVDKETLRRFGLTWSAMAVPLFDGDRLYGILALGKAEEDSWAELAPRVMVIAHTFSAALLRGRAKRTLECTLHELESAKTLLRTTIHVCQEVKPLDSLGRIVYRSRAMAEVMAKAKQVAATNASVLLSGETGTGKEMVASAIHEMSSRMNRPMVRVNCGAIPSELVENEMFGHEKGAFTDARNSQIGRFELANGSTIFLDEIIDLPLDLQVKLLRVLQEREIERLGNPKPIMIDVRVIAATNQNLAAAVKKGKFRQDLYYRLNVFPIDVPPLRERPDDIPNLVWSFVNELSLELGKHVTSTSPSTMDRLMNYSWPGNIRELRNTIERAMIVSNGPELHIEPPTDRSHIASSAALTLKEMEVKHIRKTLEVASWKIRGKGGAAEVLGMKPTTLETRMAKYGIVRPKGLGHKS